MLMGDVLSALLALERRCGELAPDDPRLPAVRVLADRIRAEYLVDVWPRSKEDADRLSALVAEARQLVADAPS
jgi:hypothetical protein